MVTTKERLEALARTAILHALGDTEKALAGLDDLITAKNSAALERELCSACRTIAMRTLLATHFHELRAKGGSHRCRRMTRRLWSRQDPRPGRRSRRGDRGAKENYLNDFRVNGEPIGDCTPEIVLEQAERRERDARFMRRWRAACRQGIRSVILSPRKKRPTTGTLAKTDRSKWRQLFDFNNNPRGRSSGSGC